MKRIFISHPFAGDPEGNRRRVDEICKNIKDALPISPMHLFGFIEEETEEHREEIMRVCKRMIDICDEVWIYGDSPGCREEKEYAKKTGKTTREGKYAADPI